ncbi:MAG: TRAM domain-containing protein [Meiothermus sp.]|uniref:PIN/TRAM domain-containing protein n=1 Tax=Meiothermus sp. TaxID=1955249 RepID=UPI0025DE1822|nr:TRAM domain-containing protein [Meiothermus sp.]MCS7069047.1 TRAM domain-containing protein [Meiothermus sp.]MDW8425004.1 TRAM domain-containing protein [Meiothermus sp.]
MSVIRWVLYALFAYLGYRVGVWLEASGLVNISPLGSLTSLNRLYLGVVGLLVGFLLVPRLAFWVERRWEATQAWLRRLPPEIPVAITAASGLGLLLAVLLTNLLNQIPGFSAIHSLIIAAVLVASLSAFAIANRDYFRLARPPAPTTKTRGGKVLDTSVLIDGRIADVVEMGFLEGPLFVPRQVLRELQQFADASDAQKRAKGRRGLDTLERLKLSVGLEVLDGSESDDPVDDQILAEARRLGSALVTNDHALAQLSRIYGVKTLSIQALASALRAPLQQGDALSITIVKEGKEPGQGVGYLEDGTMVVVDDALPFKGKEVEVVITQSIQTQVGRLLFGKLQGDASRSPHKTDR